MYFYLKDRIEKLANDIFTDVVENKEGQDKVHAICVLKGNLQFSYIDSSYYFVSELYFLKLKILYFHVDYITKIESARCM